ARVLRMARAGGAIAYWRFANAIAPAAWRAGRGMYDIAILDRDAPAGGAASDPAIRHVVRLSPLSRAARLALWQRFGDEPVPAAVRDRLLLPGEIVSAARVAASGADAV